jgi:hypothetical protein
MINTSKQSVVEFNIHEAFLISIIVPLSIYISNNGLIVCRNKGLKAKDHVTIRSSRAGQSDLGL